MKDLLEQLSPYLENQWVRSLLILLGALLAAKLTDFAITRVVRRFTAKTRTDFDDRIVALLHRPVFISVLLAGLGLITTVLDLPPVLRLSVQRILKTIAILLWSLVMMRMVTLILEQLGRLRDRFAMIKQETVILFSNLARVLIFGGAVYFVFLSWNIDVTAWMASAGIVGIAIGFAAKDTLSNLFGGVFILADGPYRVGDFINLDRGERGMVTDIGLRTTRLLTRDDVEVTVPNSVIAQSTVVNESGGPWKKTRIRVKIGVAYGSDIDLVEETLLRIAVAHEKVCEEPEPRVRFRAFGDSSLDFELLCWISEPVFRGLVLHELNRQVYKEFGRLEIQIPFPQRDVHLLKDD